jgi:oligo-alginate lyase
VALQPDRSVRVQDEFTTLDRSTRVRWAMVTRADVKVEGHGRATLTQSGKTLTFRVLEPADAKLAIYPTDPPPAPTDARNEGTRMIGFEFRVPAGKTQRLVVQLIPADATFTGAATTPLAHW